METNGYWVTGFCWKPQQRQFDSVPLSYWKKNDSEVWLESIKVLLDSAALHRIPWNPSVCSGEPLASVALPTSPFTSETPWSYFFKKILFFLLFVSISCSWNIALCHFYLSWLIDVTILINYVSSHNLVSLMSNELACNVCQLIPAPH